MKTWYIVVAAVLALGRTSFAQDKKQEESKFRNSYLGKAPPKLTIGEKDWINTKSPLTLEGLKGKVVWLQFSYTH